jgi:hypothetical protein
MAVALPAAPADVIREILHRIRRRASMPPPDLLMVAVLGLVQMTCNKLK